MAVFDLLFFTEHPHIVNNVRYSYKFVIITSYYCAMLLLRV